MQHRRQLLQALAAGGLWSALSTAQAMGTRPLTPGLRSMKGTVRINGELGRAGQLVLVGDKVSTGPASEAVFVAGHNAFLLRDDSSVQLGYDDAGPVMQVPQGKVLAVFGPGRMRIDTPTVDAVIRGTGLYLEARATQVYFCLCYGTVDLAPVADPSQARSITTTHHDSPFTIGLDRSAPLIQAAPVIGHRDLELTMLEALVGRVPPFHGQPSMGY